MINENDKIADILTKYPELKNKLIERNQKFKNLNNPLVLKDIGKFARIQDIAKVSGENLQELLDFIKKEISRN